MVLRRSLGRLFTVVAIASACVISSPDFDGTETAVSGASEATSASSDDSLSGSAGTSTSASATDSGSASSGTGTGGATTGDASTGASESSGVVTAGTSTTTGEATTDEATTGEATTTTTTAGGLDPGTYDLPPSVATCIFLPGNQLPIGGPAQCSANATAQNQTSLTDLMMVDTAVNNGDGGGRRAESYLRFDIPPEYGDLTITSATVYVQVANGPGDLPNGPSGVLCTMSPFDMASLNQSVPAIGQMIGGNSFAATNEWITWPIPPNLLTPGAPLYLAILPTSGDGTIYRGKFTEPGSPYLQVALQ